MTAPERGPETLSIVHALTVLLRYRVSILLIAALAMLGTVALGLLEQRTYTSSASFVPQSRRAQGSNLAGLAAQFGVAVPTGEAAQSPAFYAELLHSREILSSIVDTVFRTGSPPGADTISVARLLEVKERDAARRRAEAIRRLRQRIAANAATKTGVVSVAVQTESAPVSQQIAAQLIAEVNRFNLETRQSQAAAERAFTQQRLADAADELRLAENRLQAFLQGNRAISGSPSLRFTEERLSREVAQKQEVYASLVQAYEQAKIEEVRDTPVITVVESPDLPMRPDPRGLVTRGVLAGLVGLLLGMLLAFVRDVTAAGRAQGDAAFVELARLRGEAMADLRRPWRVFGRARRRSPAASAHR